MALNSRNKKNAPLSGRKAAMYVFESLARVTLLSRREAASAGFSGVEEQAASQNSVALLHVVPGVNAGRRGEAGYHFSRRIKYRHLSISARLGFPIASNALVGGFGRSGKQGATQHLSRVNALACAHGKTRHLPIQKAVFCCHNWKYRIQLGLHPC